MESNNQPKKIASDLADWAAPASNAIIYLIGSHARGDAKQESDVDICIVFDAPSDADVDWWTKNNEEDFTAIKGRLPGRLQILEMSDPLKNKIKSAPIIFQDRNVRCVYLHPEVLGRLAWTLRYYCKLERNI